MFTRQIATSLMALAVASPAMADFWSDAAAPYQGVTIRGVSESTPPSNHVRDVLAPAFTEATGIQVEFETTSWDQMYDKAIKDMEAGSGIYDFVYIEQDAIYSYLSRDFLVDMTQMMADNPALVNPEFDWANFTTFVDYFKNAEGHVFGVPMEAFIKVYLYRKDLFENPEIKASFQEKYGYELAPATTFQQWRDIAEFFTAYGQENGMELYGTTVQAASGHPASWYEFWESVAPLYGVYNWGLNQDTWTASVANGGEMNSPEAVEALTFWLGLLQYAPPEATASTWDEVASSFAAGRAAQGLVYGENATWIATDAEKSSVVGNVGVALPPTAEGIMQEAESGEGYIGYYDGGAFGIPHSSGNKEAALLFLQYIAQPQVQPDWAAASGRIVLNSTYEDPKVQEINAQTDNYFTLMKDQGALFAGAPPYPFHNQVREATAPFMYEAIIGNLTPQEALDQMAAAAEAELKNLGYAAN